MARGVAQLVAHHVRDVGVGRSSRLSSTAKAPSGVLLLLEDIAYAPLLRINIYGHNHALAI